MKQKQLGRAIRVFTEAILNPGERAEVAAAVGTLIQTLSKAARDQAAGVVSAIIDRLNRQDERVRKLEEAMLIRSHDVKHLALVCDAQARVIELLERRVAMLEDLRERAVGE